MNRIASILSLVLATACLTTAAQAGERHYLFELSTGGQIRGSLENEEEAPRQTYVIKTQQGVIITLDRDQVVRRESIPDSQLEYEKIRDDYPDTAAGHWELADWCRQHALRDERREHALRVLEFDADHAGARHALGYISDQRTGEWVTREEFFESKGYVNYKGEWLLPQQVELREARSRSGEAETRWMREVGLLERRLKGRESGQARQALIAIESPAAVPALLPRIEPDRMKDPNMREVFVLALSNIGNGPSLGGLTKVVLLDPSEEIRLVAIRELAKHQDPQVTKELVNQLTANQNVIINRAAAALTAIGDPSTVGPLINALVTTHIKTINEGNPDQITTTFGSNGANGLQTGSRQRREVVTHNNEDVRNALIAITGQRTLGYDVELWKKWYAALTRSEMMDARRGN